MRGRRFQKQLLLAAISPFLLLLGLWVTRSDRFVEAPPVASSAATGGSPIVRANPVDQQIHDLNSAEDAKKSVPQGWRPASVPAAEYPDPDLSSLNLEVLLDRPEREEALHAFLQTETLSDPALLERAAEIALRARNAKTRYLAIECLGRSPAPQAQKVLTRVFERAGSDGERRQVLAQLQPRHWDDEGARLAVGLLAGARPGDQIARQALSLLVMMELSRSPERGVRPPESALLQVPGEWRSLFAEQWASARSGSGSSISKESGE